MLAAGEASTRPIRQLATPTSLSAASIESVITLAHDPQTSGGLLAAVDPSVVASLDGFVEVGTVEAGQPGVELR